MGATAVVKGPAAVRVAANVKALREDRRLGLAQMSRRLAQVGRPTAAGTVYKIEQGERRVDVDDLVAYAAAFDVAVTDLLFEGDHSWRQQTEEPEEWRPALRAMRDAWYAARESGVPADYLASWLVRVVESVYRLRDQARRQGMPGGL